MKVYNIKSYIQKGSKAMNILQRNFINIAFDGEDGVGKTTLINSFIDSVKTKYSSGKLCIESRNYSPKTSDTFNVEEDEIDHESNMYRYMDSYIVNRIKTKLSYDKKCKNYKSYDSIIDPNVINLIDRGFLSTFFYAYLDLMKFKPLCDEKCIAENTRHTKANEMAKLYIKFENVIKKRLFYIIKNMGKFFSRSSVRSLVGLYPEDVFSAMETSATILVHNNLDKEEILKSKHEDITSVNLNDQYEVDEEFKRRLNSNINLFILSTHAILIKDYNYTNPFIGNIIPLLNATNIGIPKLFSVEDEVDILISQINSVLKQNGINPLMTKDKFSNNDITYLNTIGG
jgi:GTPase SAR1 family protein